MRYALAAILPLLLTLACNDDEPATLIVTPTVVVTSTPAPTKDKGSACDPEPYPIAGLMINDTFVLPRREAIQWSDPVAGCSITAHPFDTIFLPAPSIPVPPGATVRLLLTRQPTTTDASAWTIDSVTLGPDYHTNQDNPNIVEIENYTAMRQSSLVSLDVQPATTDQHLNLTGVPPGDTILEVGASWREGTIRWVFRIFLGANK